VLLLFCWRRLAISGAILTGGSFVNYVAAVALLIDLLPISLATVEVLNRVGRHRPDF